MSGWGRAAVAVWVAVVGFAVAKNLATPAKGTVYPLYSDAARELAAGDPPAKVISRQYLPHFPACIAAPFATFPDRYGGTLWAVANLAVLFTGVRACGRRWLPDARSQHVLLVVVPLVAVCSVGNNQSNLMIAGCLAWGAALAADGRWWAAAVVLAIPGFKVYPLGLGLTLAVLMPRRLGARFALALAAVVLSPYLLYPVGDITARFDAIRIYLSGGEHYVEYESQGVREFLVARGVELSPERFAPVQAVTAALVPLSLWLARRRGWADGEVVRWAAILFGYWCVSFGPAIEPQTYALAALPFGLLIAGTRGRPITVGLLVIAAMVCGPMETDLVGKGVRTAVVGSKLASVGVTAAFVGCLMHVTSAGRLSRRVSVPTPAVQSLRRDAVM